MDIRIGFIDFDNNNKIIQNYKILLVLNLCCFVFGLCFFFCFHHNFLYCIFCAWFAVDHERALFSFFLFHITLSRFLDIFHSIFIQSIEAVNIRPAPQLIISQKKCTIYSGRLSLSFSVYFLIAWLRAANISLSIYVCMG